MYKLYMQQDILHVFFELVVLYIMYKTETIYRITFYMKLMTASCSMSKFLPIVIIFRQIPTSQFYIFMYVSFNMFKHVTLHVCLLNMFNMFIIFLPCNTHIYIMLFSHYLHFPEQNL